MMVSHRHGDAVPHNTIRQRSTIRNDCMVPNHTMGNTPIDASGFMVKMQPEITINVLKVLN